MLMAHPGRFRYAAAVSGVLFSSSAQAHFFTQPYTLPIPLWMYASGAAAALVLSFLVIGLVARVPARSGQSQPAQNATYWSVTPGVVGTGRGVTVAALVLCIVGGMVGTQRPLENLSMTLFWVVFVLGTPYLCAICGDFYSVINPWRAIVDFVERLMGHRFEGKHSYPLALGYWPALLLYMAFIWLELFGQLSPRGLSIALIVYTALTLAGSWLFGSRTWLKYAELFSVFLRLVGTMAPFSWEQGADDDRKMPGARVRPRAPFAGALVERAEGVAMVVFILFMLSSTAYDGLHSTLPWVTVYWNGIYPHLATWLDVTPAGQVASGTRLYYVWQWLALILSPGAYLVVLWLFVWLAKKTARSMQSVRDLTIAFSMSLVPIAFVYHLTHYYTLLLAQAGQLLRLVSDPLGVGWDLFGTVKTEVGPIFLDVEVIWHTQVAVIVLGHIIGVYIAHVAALRTFHSARRASLSQLPLLVLMVLFTTMGLWILSLPLAPGS